MMKYFSFSYVKKNPVMFGIIIIVFGLLMWLLMNRGASSSGTTVVSSSTDPAASAAANQLAVAQLSSQTQLALATINANTQTQGLEAQLAATQILAQLELEGRTRDNEAGLAIAGLQAQLQSKGIDAQVSMNANNNAFQVEYARTAYNAATEQLKINAALQTSLSEQQLKAYQTSAMLAVIPTLKKKDRDETLQIIGSAAMGNPVNFTNPYGPALITGHSNLALNPTTGGMVS
jgi:hypothetical protein